VVVGPDGTAYQTFKAYPGSNYTGTNVGIIYPGSTTPGNVPLGGGGTTATALGPVVVGPDGVAYQTVSVASRFDPAGHRYVVRVSPTGAIQSISLGAVDLVGPVVVDADGNAYQTITTTDQFDRTTVAVAVIAPTATTVIDFGAGVPVGSVVVGPHGTAYQTTTHDTLNGSELVVYRIS
jgi:hypothetical protein